MRSESEFGSAKEGSSVSESMASSSSHETTFCANCDQGAPIAFDVDLLADLVLDTIVILAAGRYRLENAWMMPYYGLYQVPCQYGLYLEAPDRWGTVVWTNWFLEIISDGFGGNQISVSFRSTYGDGWGSWVIGRLDRTCDYMNLDVPWDTGECGPVAIKVTSVYHA